MSMTSLSRPIPLLALTAVGVTGCGDDDPGRVDYGVDTSALGELERPIIAACSRGIGCATTATPSVYVEERNRCVADLVEFVSEFEVVETTAACRSAIGAYFSCFANEGTCESETFSYYGEDYTYWYLRIADACDDEYYAMDDNCPDTYSYE